MGGGIFWGWVDLVCFVHGVVLGECVDGSDVRWGVVKKQKPWHPHWKRDCSGLVHFVDQEWLIIKGSLYSIPEKPHLF